MYHRHVLWKGNEEGEQGSFPQRSLIALGVEVPGPRCRITLGEGGPLPPPEATGHASVG